MKPFRFPALVGLLLAAVLMHAVPQMIHSDSMSEMAVLSCTDCGEASAHGTVDCATQCLKASEDMRNAFLPRPKVSSGAVLSLSVSVAFFLSRSLSIPNEPDPVPIGPRLIAGLAMRE